MRQKERREEERKGKGKENEEKEKVKESKGILIANKELKKTFSRCLWGRIY
jgi:hypothetical protein